MDLTRNEHNAKQWVAEHSDALYRFALQRVRDVHTAKDLVQETFLAAWRNINNYNGEASVKNWLFAILKNKIIDHYRKASNRLTDSLVGHTQEDDAYFDREGHWTADASPSEWGIDYNSPIESKEFHGVLDRCKRKLKELQAAVFTMKYLDGFESEEICRQLDLTPSNFWVIMHRAKVQLRSCLEINWFTR
jgi:RNA polymerase sigma-70 factor (ECF subfamily)